MSILHLFKGAGMENVGFSGFQSQRDCPCERYSQGPGKFQEKHASVIHVTTLLL
jgi:hypothetical protein